MLYSKTCEYAMRAVAYLAVRGVGVYVTTREVKQAVRIPGPYLSKIFQVLIRKSILKARQGPTGGIALVRKPQRLSLLNVIQAIERTELMGTDCVMGLAKCSSKCACPMHDEWEDSKKKMVKKLATSSILDISEKLLRSRFRAMRRGCLVRPGRSK